MRRLTARKGVLRCITTVAMFASLAFAGVSQATLLTNGGFESGDLSGWNSTGSWTSIVAGANTGQYAVALAENGAIGTLSQTFATIPGEDYLLSFWLYNSDQTTNLFQAVVNGNTLFDQANTPYQAYTEYNLLFTANSLTTSLLFNERHDYPGNFYLDDVAVNPVPEPGTILLIGSGLTGLMGFGWRRKRIA